MRILAFISILIFSSPLLSATSLSERLREAASSQAVAEKNIETLYAQATDYLSTEDYLVLSESYQTVNNRDAALDAANKAEQSAATPYLKALSFYHKAQIHGIFYQNAEMAIQQLVAAEELLAKSADKTSQLLLNDVLHSFASAYNLRGQLAQGLTYAERSLKLARQLNEPARELNALIIGGRLALQNNQYQQAFYYLQQGVTLASKLEDNESLASLHFRMGMAFRKLDLHPEALEHFQQAAERYRALDRQSNYAYTLIYLAETYLEEPVHTDKAESLLQEAKLIAEQQQHVLRMALVNYSLGRVALLREQYPTAEKFYQQALQQFRQVNSTTYTLETALALVRLYYQQQQYPAASALLNELRPNIAEAATYLQLRFYTSTALLAAAKNDWQQAYLAQEKATTLNQQELTEHLQQQITQLKGSLTQSSDQTDVRAEVLALQQQLSTAESRQLLLQLLLVGMIFTAFVIWHLYRRQLTAGPAPSQADSAPRQWSQFKDKVKQQTLSTPLNMLLLLPRDRTALQQRFGRKVINTLLLQVRQELDLPEVSACYSGSEMLWLATPTAHADELMQKAEQLLQQKLTALGAEPRIICSNLPLTTLLGEHWQKDDLSALPEVIWFGWHLASDLPLDVPVWQLEVQASHPRPCEWQAENLRTDMLNACKLGELQLWLNGQALKSSL
jgi:tetratricopeptide (TPR) repeat protein